MFIARIGTMVAALATLVGMSGPARADLPVRIKNETNGEVIARIHAQDNAWTPWSEVLSQDQEKRYTFRNGASVFYIEFRYDDGREWRHVCTKSINADRAFQVVTRGAVPHMDCFVEPLGGQQAAQTTSTAQQRTHIARHRTTTATHVRRTRRPAQPVQTTAALPPAPAPLASPQPATAQTTTAQTNTAQTTTAETTQQAKPTTPRRTVRHVRKHRTVATTTRTTRRPAPPASTQIPTTPDTRPVRVGSYSREAACLDVRPAWDTPATWCHEGHMARDDLRPSRR